MGKIKKRLMCLLYMWCTYTPVHNSCKTSIGVHEMHPNYGLATILLAHDQLSSLTYPRIPHAPHVAGNLPIKLWLLGNDQQVVIEKCAVGK